MWKKSKVTVLRWKLNPWAIFLGSCGPWKVREMVAERGKKRSSLSIRKSKLTFPLGGMRVMGRLKNLFVVDLSEGWVWVSCKVTIDLVDL